MSQIILHIGHSKTGSTTIQNALREGYEVNLSRGILYPTTKHIRHCHHFIVPLALPRDQVIHHIINRMGFDYETCKRLSQEEWNDVLHESQTISPEKIVLSSESLFRPISSKSTENLKMMMSQLGDSLRVLAYIRSPIAHYLSLAQQALQNRSTPIRFVPNNSTETVKKILDGFGSGFEMRAFERQQLVQGDVFFDFSEWAGLELMPPTTGSLERNMSISAEAMSVLNRLGRPATAENEKGYIVQRDLVRMVKAVDTVLPGPTKPRLKPELVEDLTRMSTGMLWLLEHHGVRFSDVAYDIIGRNSPREAPEIKGVEQMCDFDRARRNALEAEVKHRLNPTFLSRVMKRLR